MWGRLVQAFVLLVTGVVCPACFANAQKRATKNAKDSAQVLGLIRQAERLPVEFRADVEFNAIESGRIPKTTQRHLLEDLFQNAQFAHDPFKMRNVVKISDLRAIKVTTAYTLNLDETSIRTRAIEGLLKIDPAAARRLWNDIRLSVPQSACISPYVYDVSGYYSTLRDLLAHGFTSVELNKGAPVSLLQQEIQRATSPMQLDELALLASDVNQTDDQLSSTVALYTALLQRVEASDRELGAISSPLLSALTRFVILIKERGQDTSPVVIAYRSFLIRGAKAGTCKDQPANREELVQGFGRLQSLAKVESATLSEKDLKPDSTSQPLEADHIPEGSEFEGMLRPLMALQQAKGADKNLDFPSAESDAMQFLAKIDAINDGSGPCHACVFHEKADFYLILLNFAPSKEIEERVATRLARFLAADPMEQESPIEWLFRVKLLLNLTRQPDESQRRRIDDFEKRGLHLTMLPSDARSEILQAIELSHNEVMSLYEVADKVLKNGYVLPPV